jgi:hypothetical protein
MFESAQLAAIAAAFESRGKAIRYQVRSFVIERELEGGDDACERLNIDLQRPVDRARLRLSLWPDGVLWFGA